MADATGGRTAPGGGRDASGALVRRRPVHSGPVMLWKTNRRCNLRCDYCFSSGTDLAVEDPLCGKFSPDHIARRFDETGQSWLIILTGGEPFLYPDVLGLCRELSKNHLLALNTNLAASRSERFADEIDPARVRTINASLHIAELERIGKLERFLGRVRFFQDRGFPIGVEYVAYPSLFNRIDRDLRTLEEGGVRVVNMKVFRGRYGLRTYPAAYSKKEQEYFRLKSYDATEEDFVAKRYAFFGRACGAGRDVFFMDIGGFVRRCPGSARSYGNLFDGSFSPDREPRPCPFPICFAPWISRDHAGGRRRGSLSILEEISREWPPFLADKTRRRLVFRSLRNRL